LSSLSLEFSKSFINTHLSSPPKLYQDGQANEVYKVKAVQGYQEVDGQKAFDLEGGARWMDWKTVGHSDV
tara:strand:- start:748 stop:957 length:210 start_codon:yes stop_codon:yes gene_type:complete